jgi:hypothetical protein
MCLKLLTYTLGSDLFNISRENMRYFLNVSIAVFHLCAATVQDEGGTQRKFKHWKRLSMPQLFARGVGGWIFEHVSIQVIKSFSTASEGTPK